jgi:hypothetical protein
MDHENEHSLEKGVNDKMLDLEDEFQLGLNEGKLLFLEECLS